MQLLFGIDIFLTQASAYANKRIALITNDAATTSSGLLSRAAMQQQGFNISKLFSPEHGISRTGEDGVAQHNSIDAVTKLPVISLYGEKLAPSAADLADVDIVVFDIPDAGCRFYTYLWTMTHVMEACAQYHLPLIILDRPNPIGADIAKAEGPFLDEDHCASFIGRWNIPLKHSCTLAELAQYFSHGALRASAKVSGLSLTVIPCSNYQRQYTAVKDFAFVPTSPALQNIASAMLYPGLCLLEAVNINEGRGTALPFTICGAPFINAKELLQHWLLKNIPGVQAAAISYTPQSSVYAGQLCHGLQFTITNAAILQPVALGIALLQTLLQLYPQQITEKPYPTAANPTGTAHLDKLLGIPNAFALLKTGQAINTTVNPLWQHAIKNHLLY